MPVPHPPTLPPALQAFLKDCLSHASSDPGLQETMGTIIASQMFERFIEERLNEPDHPQIKVSTGGKEGGREGGDACGVL
jgi:hypothetical protein